VKTLPAFALAPVPLLSSGAALAQNGHMMDGGSWGGAWMGGWMDGYGATWLPILLLVVVVGFAVWVVRRK
jgi:hypothetical protein